MQEPTSIGPQWPPEIDRRNDRIKGFYTQTINSVSKFEDIVSYATNEAFLNSLTRITARCLVTNAQLENIVGKFGERIEAHAALDSGWDATLVYFGANFNSRHSQLTAAEREILETARSIERPVIPSAEIARVKRNGYDLEILAQPAKPSEVTSLVALYTQTYTDYPFDLNEQNVELLLNNPENITCVAKAQDGQIAAVGLAERCVIPIDNKLLHLAEITGAATDRGQRGNGLYAGIAAKLLGELANGHVDYVYGEATAGSSAVNRACRSSGREYSGSLMKHCRMSGTGVGQTGQYANLNVWGMTGTKLSSLYIE